VEKLIKKTNRRRKGLGLEVVIRKRTDKELVIKLVGEDHTIGNLIAKMALNHPNVRLAAYTIEHPLEGSPVIRIVTDGTVDPGQVLKEVVVRSKAITEELLKELRETLGVED